MTQVSCPQRCAVLKRRWVQSRQQPYRNLANLTCLVEPLTAILHFDDRAERKNNEYIYLLPRVSPKGFLTCLVAKRRVCTSLLPRAGMKMQVL